MRALKLAILSCTALAGTQAFAEDTTAAEDNEIVVTGQYVLPDKIDTATGLGLTVQETPQSVSIVTAQRILDQNLVSAADVLVNAVGISTNELDDVRNEFFARGFEVTTTQIDGVPIPWLLAGSAGETSIDMSIYERVEVVRGATGLLTGAGDPSASINFVRKHADARDWTGYANASYGSWNTWRVSADVGGALDSAGRIRVRAVGRYEEGDSYIDLYHDKKFVLYGTVDADVTDTTLVRAGIAYQKRTPDSPAWGNLPYFYSDGSVTDWPRSKTATADWTYWNTTNQNIFGTIRQQIGDNWTVTANYNRTKNTEASKLLYLSGTVDVNTGVIQYAYPYKDEGQNLQNSFDAQIKGNVNLFGRDHEIVLGAITSKQSRYTDAFSALSYPLSGPQYTDFDGTDYPDPGFSTTPNRAVEDTVKQTGYYGALRLNLSDQLKVIGGGRVSSWKQKGFDYSGVSDYGDSGVFIPYIGALYDIVPDVRVYASFTKIFQPQNATDVDFKQLDPVEGKAYEIGLKAGFLNNRLQTSLALFRIVQDNLAVYVDVHTPPGGGLPQSYYRPADGTVSKGFEAEINGELGEGWNLNFGLSHFSIKDENDLAVATEQPRTLIKLFTTYTPPSGALSGLTVGGGVNYRSVAYQDGTNTATGAPFRFQQDAYALISLMARYEINESLQLQANLDNLLDKKYFAQAGFYAQYRYGAPRNFTVSATYKF